MFNYGIAFVIGFLFFALAGIFIEKKLFLPVPVSESCLKEAKWFGYIYWGCIFMLLNWISSL